MVNKGRGGTKSPHTRDEAEELRWEANILRGRKRDPRGGGGGDTRVTAAPVENSLIRNWSTAKNPGCKRQLIEPLPNFDS